MRHVRCGLDSSCTKSLKRTFLLTGLGVLLLQPFHQARAADPYRDSAGWRSNGDQPVCSAFYQYFSHQRKRLSDGTGTTFIEDEGEPWAGVRSVPSLPADKGEFDQYRQLGYEFNGVRYNEQPSQLFIADLFHDNHSRIIVITTTSIREKFRNSAVMIMKSAEPLRVRALDNEFNPDMTIYGPDPSLVDFRLGNYFTINPSAYDDVENNKFDTAKINSYDIGNDPLIYRSHLQYFLYWNLHTHYASIQTRIKDTNNQFSQSNVVLRSDFYFKGKSKAENARLTNESDFTNFVTGFNAVTKSYLLGNDYYFVSGLPMANWNHGSFIVYRVTPNWKIEIICDRL